MNPYAFSPLAGRTLRHVATGLVLGSCAALGACSGVGALQPGVASYGSSNIFSPAGYNQAKVDDTHFKVQATGTEATPKPRVEKIAMARAAEIGVQEKLKYFKVTNVQHGYACGKAQPGYKSEGTQPSSRPTVVLDVVFAQEPADAAFLSSAESYKAWSDELAAEDVPPEARAAAAQETRAACGQS